MNQQKRVPNSYTDGGRAEAGFFHERSDCAVRAVAQFCNTTYAEAHAQLKAEGRKDGHGTYNHQYAPSLDAAAGYNAKFNLDPKLSTVGRVLRAYPNAKLAIAVPGHIFYVENGVQKDTHSTSLYRRVRKFWVKDASPVVPARKTRSKVRVAGVVYRSVFEAFVQLALPLSKHQAFRKQLKAAGMAGFGELWFEVVV